MAIDENQISLRPGGGSKRPVSFLLQSANRNRPSAPFNSTRRPLAALQSSDLPMNSCHQPAVSRKLSAPLQSSSHAPSRTARVDLQAQATRGLRNSEPITTGPSTASVDLQTQVNSEPITTGPSTASVDLQTKVNSDPIRAAPWIASVDLQTQTSAGVIKYSRDKLLQLERKPVERATFLSIIKNIPDDFLRRDAEHESSRNENHDTREWRSERSDHNQISGAHEWRSERSDHNQISGAHEWRSERSYHNQISGAHEWRSERTYPDVTTSRHPEPMKAVPVPVSGPSALAKAAVPWSAARGKLSEKDKVLKTVKGILNKLTPEKFDSLKDQLLNSGITAAHILQGVISLLFDKAVMEPTFCFMYAELCVHLSSGLPEFPPEEPDGKPISFKRVLLNTCQTEFEGANGMRAQLKEITGPQFLEKEQLLKRRTLGNIRFIAELFKQKMLPKPIVNACIQELFGDDIKAPPVAENVEALCQLFSLIGKQLEEMGGSKQRGTSIFDSYMARLKSVGNYSGLESRIKFLVRDVIELRANKWIPRREEVKAKTISEIHTEAERKLGLRPGTTRRQINDAPRGTYKPEQNYLDPTDNKTMRPRLGDDVWRSKTLSNSMPAQNLRSSSRPTVSTSISPPVSSSTSAYRPPPLHPTSSTSMVRPASNANLLPRGKWSSILFSKPPSFPSKASALLYSNEKEEEEKPFLPSGQTSSLISSSSQKPFLPSGPTSSLISSSSQKPFLPSGRTTSLISSISEKQKEKQPKQIEDSSSALSKAEKLTTDDLERKTQSLLKEYFHVRDLKEASQCVKDLDSPTYHAQLLFQAISMALEQKELHVQMVGELMDHLLSDHTMSKVNIRDGFLLIAEQYDDFAIDVPLAPKHIGRLLGKCALNGTVDLKLLYDVLTKIEDNGSRKKILDTALCTIKSDQGGKHLLSVQEAELSGCESLIEE